MTDPCSPIAGGGKLPSSEESFFVLEILCGWRLDHTKLRDAFTPIFSNDILPPEY